jgi:adenosylcobinamide kinase / adenosylcobinamide-phosphate guanylyltransferase
MARIILITGGARSGKSTHAQQLAESLPGPRTYVATCPVLDEEMAERIRRHQKERASGDWTTIEEEVALAEILDALPKTGVVLVDCLTLWVNNLLYQAEQQGQDLSEKEAVQHCAPVLEAAARHRGTVIFVTNELGMGIVPADAVSRRYRDFVGRMNQQIAAHADEVIFLVSGIPLYLKGKENP